MSQSKAAQKKGPGAMATKYLLFYNMFQCAGWGYVLFKITTQAIAQWSCKDLWSPVSGIVLFFQTLGLLEVLHCMIKIVPSSAFQTLQQMSSRLYVVWIVMFLIPESHKSYGVPLLLFAWCVAEVTRYSYYAFNLLKSTPYFLLWCRYTFFIVLYPIGVTGELLSMLSSYPYIRDRGLLSIPLPNKLNFSFHMHYLHILVMLIYIPIFPQLYMYMMRQRKKFLGTPADSKKAE